MASARASAAPRAAAREPAGPASPVRPTPRPGAPASEPARTSSHPGTRAPARERAPDRTAGSGGTALVARGSRPGLAPARPRPGPDVAGRAALPRWSGSGAARPRRPAPRRAAAGRDRRPDEGREVDPAQRDCRAGARRHGRRRVHADRDVVPGRPHLPGEAQLRDGSTRQLPPGPTGGLLDIDLGRLGADDVDRLLVDWPSRALRTMTLIDTPGLDSLSAELSRGPRTALAPGAGTAVSGEVDAVIYLMRHVHASDVHFLEAFRDDPTDRRPLNTIGMLARADEVGSRPARTRSRAPRRSPRATARTSGSAACARPSSRWPGCSPRARRRCARTSSASFGKLASAPVEADVDRLLLTASRFARAESEVDLESGPPRRAARPLRHLRAAPCVRLLREGTVTTAGEAVPRARSAAAGSGPLRETLMTRLAGRADVLRAQSAHRGGRARSSGAGRCAAASALRGEIEQIIAGAHEFAEVRLLDRLHTGRGDAGRGRARRRRAPARQRRPRSRRSGSVCRSTRARRRWCGRRTRASVAGGAGGSTPPRGATSATPPGSSPGHARASCSAPSAAVRQAGRWGEPGR